MNYDLLTNIESCYVDIPNLLYYSHIPSTIIVLIFGIFVLFKSKEDRLSGVILFLISIVFLLWTSSDIILWTTYSAPTMMFFWSLFSLLYALMFTLTLSFAYSMLAGTNILRGKLKYFLALLLLPFVLFLPTTINLSQFDITNCEPIENYLTWYQYLYGIFVAIWIAFMAYARYRKAEVGSRGRVVVVTLAIFSFLVAFTWSEIAGSMTRNWEYTQYGLFGMPVFVGLLAYLIVRYHAFNIKLLGAQALVVTLWFLIGSLLFVAVSTQTRVVAGITLILAIIGGYFLIRSVKKEVEQREEIAKLAETLAKANERLKILDKLKSEFVSIASHQLRSPLTAVRGYASMLVEGSYGKLPEKAQDAAVNIADSAKYMALSVEDYLNVSRIEAGNMKYEYSDFNLKETAERIVDELRPVAMKKGLVMVFRSDCSGSCTVHADIGKVRQVIMNLLDNSMKYTPKGTITVVAHDDVKAKKMYVTIEDTGVGMSKETQEEVFDKFVRAKNANNVNTTGTGLGLYVAKKMITDMKGKVWAESEGEGKGSTFHVELPLLPGKAGR